MTVEHHDYDDERETPPEKHSDLYLGAVRRFDNGSKLDHDTFNVWNSLAYVDHRIPNSFERITPRQHYGEYVAKIDRSWGEGGGYEKMIMQRSDPQAVAAFDRLVDEFNADLERIKREQDLVCIKAYVAKAQAVVYEKN